MIDIRSFDDYTDIDKPRRLKKYVLVWCSRGTLIAVVDEKELKLRGYDVLTITSGQIHYLKNSRKAEGFILEFTMDFFCKNDNDIELIFHNGLFCHFDLNEVINTTSTFVFQSSFRCSARADARSSPRRRARAPPGPPWREAHGVSASRRAAARGP